MTERGEFRIRWTLGAASDLEKILDYIEKNSPVAAARFGDRLLQHIEQLARFPLSCAPSLNDPRVRVSVFENHVIYYSVGRNEVVIKVIVHGARHPLDTSLH